MNRDTETKRVNKIKRFFGSLAEKIDKKMEEKAKSGKCCSSAKDRDSACCG